MSLSQKFSEHVQKKKLIEKNDRILVAFSGGKDSLCLLSLLKQISEKFNFSVGACHVHHNIRGKEADLDLDFCKKICSEQNIPFFEMHVDVPSFAKEKGLGLEEGARILRYDALESVADKENYNKIATAHTASDQAETVLFRIIRGSGFSGTSGIPSKRDRIIRPLLPFFTEEILCFLEENALPFKEDSTNSDILYSRNRIRKEIIPQLKQINPSAEDALVRFSFLSAWQEEMIQDICDCLEEKENISPESQKVPLSSLLPLAAKTSGYPLLYEILSRMAKNEKIVIDFERFTALIGLINCANEGKIIEISNGYCFTVEKQNLIFFKNDEKISGIEYEKKLTLGENDLSPLRALLTLSDKRRGKVENINKKLLIIHAAFDKIEGDLFARNLRYGDKIAIGQMTRSVKKLLGEAGISAKDRSNVPMICDAKGIIWIPFVGLCDRVRHSETDEIFTLTLHSKDLF
ncbi:MAG: tRNA lysidine(34) synthetase TilS, partial [Clostridia bacterium]|nr:tRNA lysidine(34) synthetase TilS [Clostridia bacterium]